MNNDNSKHIFSILSCCRFFEQHPFNLTTPTETWEIRFVGAEATDMSVVAFTENIRHYAGYTPEDSVHKLCVTSFQFPDSPSGHHFVFYEVWIGDTVIISGETTNCSGAGNEAREELEDIFAVLKQVYNIEEIDRVTLTTDMTSSQFLKTLYKER
jgi:hypothetical protein